MEMEKNMRDLVLEQLQYFWESRLREQGFIDKENPHIPIGPKFTSFPLGPKFIEDSFVVTPAAGGYGGTSPKRLLNGFDSCLEC
jgi:hypothetical protein